MIKEKLTERQDMTLQAIKDFIEKYEYAPTVREISKMLGKSPATVFQSMKILKRKHYIDYQLHSARTIKVLGE